MLNKKRILLIEDNPDDVELALLAFRKLNLKYSVEVVLNGEDALDYVFMNGKYATRNKCENPDIVILDLNLPKIDGYKVLKSIRANTETKYMPVIVFTTSGEQTDLRLCYDLGANSYIRKPVDFEKFLEVLRNLGNYWLNLNEMPKSTING